jgi:hypothetical protein
MAIQRDGTARKGGRTAESAEGLRLVIADDGSGLLPEQARAVESAITARQAGKNRVVFLSREVGHA